MNERIRSKKVLDRFMTLLCKSGAGLAVLLLLAFISYVLLSGFSVLTPSMLAFDAGGLGNLLFNTLYIVFLALAFSLLTGVPAGVYLAEYAKKGRLTRWVRMAIETLASLPSTFPSSRQMTASWR